MDAARAASRIGEPRFTRFLEPASLPLAERAARQQRVSCLLFGGYEGAERVMAAFSQGAEIGREAWPIRCLRVRWNEKYSSIEHRDLLGALMAQGMDRSCLGDIILGEGEGHVFATPDAARHLMANLISAGRAALKIEEVPLGEVAWKEPEGRQMRVTVAQLRLDAVLAEGMNLSRAEAQNLIARGLVKLNHVEQLRADARLSEGDLISARGYGRLRVDRELGETKKGRMAVMLFLYGK